MATLEEATSAKVALRWRIGRPPWLRGIGVALDAEGYYVKVNVAEVNDEVRAEIPPHIGSVRIKLEAVGDISPLSKPD